MRNAHRTWWPVAKDWLCPVSDPESSINNLRGGGQSNDILEYIKDTSDRIEGKISGTGNTYAKHSEMAEKPIQPVKTTSEMYLPATDHSTDYVASFQYFPAQIAAPETDGLLRGTAQRQAESCDSNSSKAKVQPVSTDSKTSQVNTLLSAWKIGSQLEAASAGHSGNSTTSLEAGSQAAQTSSPTGKTGLKPEEICNGAAQSKVTPADPEAAFWDNLLSAKPLPSAPVARESQAEGTVEVARPLPSSSIKRTAKPSKTLRGPVSLAKESEKSPAVRPMESEGPLAIKSNHENLPLPKVRPGKSGITKLWLPGMPQKSLQKPLSADQGQKPQKLLQRGLQKQPKKEVVDSAQYQESNPGSLDGQAYVAEDLDWLSNYMEDDVEEAEDAIVDSTGEGLAEDFKGKSWEEAGEKLANYMANNPDTSTNSLHKAAQVLSDDFEAAETPDTVQLTSSIQPPAPLAPQIDTTDDSDEVTGEPWWTGRNLGAQSRSHDKRVVSDPEHEGAQPLQDSLWTIRPFSTCERGRPGLGYSSDSSGCEDVGYDNLVESMMQAWNGGIAPSPPLRPAGEVNPEFGVDEHEEGRKIFKLPQKSDKDQKARKARREKRQRHPSQTASRQENTSQLSEEVWHSTAGRRVPLIPGVDQETKPLTADEIQSGVQSIKEVFPEVHQTVAELTLKSYEGDVEEAITFLKMTSLTATPSQLGRLGLISKKSAKALDNPSHAGSTLTTSTPDNLGTSSGDEAMQTLAADHQLMDGRSLAESLLQASHPSEAIAMAMKGAELTVAERERLRKEEDLARQQWNQRTRAKQIFNEAAAQMESKGQIKAARHLRTLAYEQSKQAAEYRQQCNTFAFRVSNQHVTNRIKLDLHGMSVEESIEKLKDHIARLTGLSSATFIIEVIVGVGKHSAGGIARLSPAVKQYLTTNSLTWNEEPGNPGQINVIIASSQDK